MSQVERNLTFLFIDYESEQFQRLNDTAKSFRKLPLSIMWTLVPTQLEWSSLDVKMFLKSDQEIEEMLLKQKALGDQEGWIPWALLKHLLFWAQSSGWLWGRESNDSQP